MWSLLPQVIRNKGEEQKEWGKSLFQHLGFQNLRVFPCRLPRPSAWESLVVLFSLGWLALHLMIRGFVTLLKLSVEQVGVSTEVCLAKPTSATSTNWLPWEVPREAVNRKDWVLFIIYSDFSSTAFSPPPSRLPLLLAQIINLVCPKIGKKKKSENRGTSYFDFYCIFSSRFILRCIICQNEIWD